MHLLGPHGSQGRPGRRGPFPGGPRPLSAAPPRAGSASFALPEQVSVPCLSRVVRCVRRRGPGAFVATLLQETGAILPYFTEVVGRGFRWKALFHSPVIKANRAVE